MISSEVQRTLVKSPPELWTELSDPAKLARHLCELGEIRITGTDPERLVEWKADTASGTILIKPAGWGTKVTLSVVTEPPRAEPPAPAQIADGPSQTAGGHSSPAAQDATEPHAPSAPSPAPGPVAEPQLSPGLAVEPQLPPTPRAEATREEPLLASPRLLGAACESEPNDPVGAEPESDPKPAASEAHDPPAAVPALSAEAVEAPVEPELVPRRGFFARLLARWRGAAPDAAGGASEADAAARAESEAPATRSPETTTGLELERGASERREFDRASGALPPTAAQPSSQASEEAPREPPEEPSSPLASAPQETASEPARHPDAPTPGADISAELRTAEEVAAEHVQAVLTSVLDSLGAAHHRPFSRA